MTVNVVVNDFVHSRSASLLDQKKLTSGVLTNPSTIVQSSALRGVLLNRRDVKRNITKIYAAERHMAPDAIRAGTRVWFSCASWYSTLADILLSDWRAILIFHSHRSVISSVCIRTRITCPHPMEAQRATTTKDR